MDESASTGLFEASTQAHEYTFWQHPFRDLRIYMHPAVLRAISSGALQSLKSREPSEIGGILRGRTSVGPKGVTATIEDAEFVPPEGRLYNATQRDQDAILRALKKQTNQINLSVIGYFRSDVREDLCLSARDEGLITQNIRETNSVFLLVRPFDIGMCMAAFFFWDKGKLQTDASDLEVPFVALEEPVCKSKAFTAQTEGLSARSENGISRSSETNSFREPQQKEASRGATPEVSKASSLHQAESPEPISIPIIQIPVGTQMTTVTASTRNDNAQSRQNSQKTSNSQTSGRRDSALFALAIAFSLLAVMIAGVYFSLPALRSYLLAPATYDHKTQIALSVNRAADGQLDLSWNRDAPELAKAQGARLTITDGSLYKEVNMDNAQLHLGKVAYFSNSPDVQFRLEVYLDSRRSLAESVRVISPASKAESMAVNSPTSKTGKTESVRVTSSASKTTIAAPISRSGDGTKVIPITVQSHAPSASIPPDVFNAKFPSRVDPKSGRSPDSNGLVSQIPKDPQQLEAPSFSVAETNSSHMSVPSGLTSAPPFVTRAPVTKTAPTTSETGSIVAYVPPRPLKRVTPNGIYLGQPLVVYENTQVEIELNIDATGRVTDAHPVQDGKKANLRLASSAVSAARQWRFEPATLHGKPVASQHTLVFVFHPGS